jgi:preprotein translocase subunit YajC
MPHKKQQQKKQAMIAALKKGDRVITTGGIFGTVATVEDNALMIKVSENTKIRVAKSAIAGPVGSDGSVPEQ